MAGRIEITGPSGGNDMAIGTGAAMLGSAAIGGIASAFGARDQAKRSYKMTRKLRQTAYQDTMYDMKKAGLNPILAYRQGANNQSTFNAPNIGAAAVEGVQKATASAKEAKILSEQLNLLGKQAYAATQSGNASKQLAIQRQKQNWNLEVDNTLRALGMPAETAVAEMLGDNPWAAKMERVMGSQSVNSARSVIEKALRRRSK